MRSAIIFLTFVIPTFGAFHLQDGFKFFSSYIQLFTDISEPCKFQLQELKKNLEDPSPDYWGARMVDASSKVQSGILSLNIGELGNFEQCINIKSNLTTGRSVYGKYCLGFLSLDPQEMAKYLKFLDDRVKEQMLIHKKSSIITNLAMIENNTMIQGPTWAGCFPHACTTKDINKLVNKVVAEIASTNTTIVFTDMFCQTAKDAKPKHFTKGGAVTWFLLWLYLVFICVCTIVDILFQLMSRRRESRLYEVIGAFSIYNNINKLFTVRDSPNEIVCLNGLRVLSMMWVVVGHQYSITSAGPIVNTIDLVKWASSWHSMFFISGTLAVDTFLLIGALLVTMGYLKYRQSGQCLSIPKFYLHRYIRLTPPLAAVVAVSATLLFYMGSGPRWPSVVPYFQENCFNYWWSALLYVQNYANVTNMCVGQTWYLAIDMQLYILSPILLSCLYKYPKPTINVICICISITIGLSFYISWKNELTAIISNPFGNLENYSNKYYLLTHTRAAPWFIGVLLGYLLHLHSNQTISIPIKEIYSTLLWLICLATLLFCIFIGHGFLRQQNYKKLDNALYIALIRPIWSLAICWIIYACVTDKGYVSEVANNILGYRLFKVLNRFNYSIYLLHVTMMYLVTFSRKSPVYFSDFEMMQRFWGTLVVNIVLAFFWILFFESPFVALEKILFSHQATHQEVTELNQERDSDNDEDENETTNASSSLTASNPTRSTISQRGDAIEEMSLRSTDSNEQTEAISLEEQSSSRTVIEKEDEKTMETKF